MEEVI
jgi:hypothetical protein